jgi:hypothetical protein
MRPLIGRHRDDLSMIVKAIRKAARHYKKIGGGNNVTKATSHFTEKHEE